MDALEPRTRAQVAAAKEKVVKQKPRIFSFKPRNVVGAHDIFVNTVQGKIKFDPDLVPVVKTEMPDDDDVNNFCEEAIVVKDEVNLEFDPSPVQNICNRPADNNTLDNDLDLAGNENATFDKFDGEERTNNELSDYNPHFLNNSAQVKKDLSIPIAEEMEDQEKMENKVDSKLLLTSNTNAPTQSTVELEDHEPSSSTGNHGKKSSPTLYPYSCKECRLRFQTSSIMSIHLCHKKCEGKESLRLRCPICSTDFQQKNLLTQHILRSHIKCPFPNCNFVGQNSKTSEKSIYTHVSLHLSTSAGSTSTERSSSSAELVVDNESMETETLYSEHHTSAPSVHDKSVLVLRSVPGSSDTHSTSKSCEDFDLSDNNMTFKESTTPGNSGNKGSLENMESKSKRISTTNPVVVVERLSLLDLQRYSLCISSNCPSQSTHLQRGATGQKSKIPSKTFVAKEHINQDIATERGESVALTHTAPDNQRLFTIFTKEVWLTILGNGVAAANYQSIINVSYLFRSLLKSERVKFLLSKVLRILLQRKDKGLEFNDFLNLRRVCVTWKVTMDNLFCTKLFSLRFSNHCEKFYKTFRAFQNYFDPTHLNNNANPFLLREIVVRCPDKREQLYFEGFHEMLLKYGHHIWKCTVKFGSDWWSPAYIYTRMDQILASMPNLKHLHVVGYYCHMSKHYYKLHPAYESIEIPTLPSLKILVLEFVPVDLVYKLLKRNLQVEIVRILELQPKDYLGIYLDYLPNLKQMTIEITDEEEFAMLQNTEVVSHPSKLDLQIDYANLFFTDELFQTLETKFGETLTELHICLMESDELQYSSGLSLPKLKILGLKMDYPACIDFILPLENNLEELLMEITGEGQGEMTRVGEADEGNTIKIYKYFSQLHLSNIWEQLPKLKIVKAVCTNVYWCTRRKWAAYKNNRVLSTSSNE